MLVTEWLSVYGTPGRVKLDIFDLALDGLSKNCQVCSSVSNNKTVFREMSFCDAGLLSNLTEKWAAGGADGWFSQIGVSI